MMRCQPETEVKHKKILLIDDDEKFSDDLSFLLNGPYQIMSVSESKKGIELLEKERFELVILDLKMPACFAAEEDLEGIEVLRIIREKLGSSRETRIPVIIVSKMDTQENRRRCEHLEADAFFAKPPEIEVLKKKMQELLA